MLSLLHFKRLSYCSLPVTTYFNYNFNYSFYIYKFISHNQLAPAPIRDNTIKNINNHSACPTTSTFHLRGIGVVSTIKHFSAYHSIFLVSHSFELPGGVNYFLPLSSLSSFSALSGLSLGPPYRSPPPYSVLPHLRKV